MAAQLSEKVTSCEVSLTPVDNRRLMDLCGRFDEHLRQIEKRLGVEINNRGNSFLILGDKQAVHLAHSVLNTLYAQTEKGAELTPASVHLCIQDHLANGGYTVQHSAHLTELALKTKKGVIQPRSPNQAQYVKNIQSHDVIFGVGPAGSGKTYLAVACAVAALEANKVERILLVRPAVEAGERLGFLPGDLAQKIDPYLRPLYDALYEMLGPERVTKYIERNVIELAPLAYMRGRTLSSAFIILDESQNTTREQMKMFLTRIGFGSTAVITGDVTQIDLPKGTQSGLKHAIKVFNDIEGMSFNYFSTADIVRHPIVQRIVDAYTKYENDESDSNRD
jgi:phosphate starvation-inducible PhoH-like protein